MNKNTKDIYKGVNPIYESMMASILEDKGTEKKTQALDTISLLSNAMNTFFTILSTGKNESIKTVRGFQEIKNKVLGTNNFGSFRQYLISVIDSLAAMDNAQKDAYRKNIQYITDLLAGTEQTLADPKLFDSAKKDTITKLLLNFENDLKEREAQMKKTNPLLLGQVVKQGLVVQEGRSGEESDVEDAAFRGKAFNKSKGSLDAASAFVGMIDRDKYVAVLKNNEDVKRFTEVAAGLYKKAQDLQMIDRKGIVNIITPSGEFKRKDYVRQQDNLLNDIIRQKKEYERIKDGVLKAGGLTPPPVVAPPIIIPKPTGSEGSESGSGDKKPTPAPTSACTFPVKLNTKCNEIGEMQNKLMEIIPSVKEYLPKKGGADKIYGKGTATVSNIIWSYLSGNTGQSLESDLTEEMYKAIMALTAKDIDINTGQIVGAAIKDSKKWEMSIEDKIQEREEIKGSPILSFEDFYSVIEESYSFAKLDEQVFDRLKGQDKGSKTEPSPVVTSVKLKDSCIKDSIAQGKVLPCAGATEKTDKPVKPNKPEDQEITWKGLKPVNDGAYTIYFDESWADWWGDTSKGVLIAGLITGAVIITGGAALTVAAPAVLAGTAVEAGVLAAISAGGIGSTLAGAGAIGTAGALASGAGAIALTAGAIGGASIAKWAGSDRKTATILVFNGYIENLAVKAMARGLYNSLAGTVSSQDLLAIYSTLILCRGTYTDNGSGKAVSVWEKIKKDYVAMGGGSLGSEINNITSGGAGGFFKDIVTDMDDIPGFPTSFKTKNPTSGGAIDFEGAKDACDNGVQLLEGNVTKIAENCKHISEEDLEMLSEGMGDITEEVSTKVKGKESSED